MFVVQSTKQNNLTLTTSTSIRYAWHSTTKF